MTPLPPPSQIPWRFREEQFRTYEPILHVSITQHPDISIFDAQMRQKAQLPPSLETCSARCRDAIQSLGKYHWDTYIDIVKFHALLFVNDIAVGQRDGLLLLGPLKLVRAYGKTIVPQQEPTAQTKATKEPLTFFLHFSDLETIVRLYEAQVFNQPIVFYGDFSQTDIDHFEASRDITFTKQDNGWLLV